MKNNNILSSVKEKANKWLAGNFDNETKKQVKHLLLAKNQAELIDSFYKDLEFGTGGLRGIMGAGTNRMNIYTVGMATQGLCNYLKQQFNELKQIKVAIAYDCRNNSRLFATTTAKIFSANNIKVYLFESLRPTPELSFTIRHLDCQGGVVITASHNPKEYNGYKVYWDDGGQLIPPHDKNIINEVRKISIAQVKFSGNEIENSLSANWRKGQGGADSDIVVIGEKIDNIYLENIKLLSLSPEVIEKNKDLKIVYTPIHGTGVKLIPEALKMFGFTNIYNVPEQDITDGNFPTVVSPNPEEPAALNLAIEKAKELDAELVMGTDPDADRVGIVVKNSKGGFTLLNGNQTGVILMNYLITKWAEKGNLTGKEYIVKTIVTTELIKNIAVKHNIECFDVLTGFKYIAALIKQNEKNKIFICGGEESYGYLAGDFVRDKDAVISCALIAETAAWARDNSKSLFDVLLDIYLEYGFYKELLTSIYKKGKDGAEEIQRMMNKFRNTPPKLINNSKVVLIKDYLTQKETDILTGKQKNITLPKSNVLQFFLKDESKISIRPSGTEPKIKFYFSVKEKLNNKEDFEKVNKKSDERIDNYIAKLLNC